LDAKVVAEVAGVAIAPVEGVAMGTEVIAIATKVPLQQRNVRDKPIALEEL
jgi:hypothetical protein